MTPFQLITSVVKSQRVSQEIIDILQKHGYVIEKTKPDK